MTLVAYADTPPQAGWDIHCHTVYSDGTETPRTLVREAVRRGLHGVAIADHDTTAGWREAEQAARELSMTLLRGTEITAVDDGVSVHMLGLQYDPERTRASANCSPPRGAPACAVPAGWWR